MILRSVSCLRGKNEMSYYEQAKQMYDYLLKVNRGSVDPKLYRWVVGDTVYNYFVAESFYKPTDNPTTLFGIRISIDQHNLTTLELCENMGYLKGDFDFKSIKEEFEAYVRSEIPYMPSFKKEEKMNELELKVNDLYEEINQLNTKLENLQLRCDTQIFGEILEKVDNNVEIKLKAYGLINDIATSDEMIDSCEFRHYVEGVIDMANQMLGGEEKC